MPGSLQDGTGTARGSRRQKIIPVDSLEPLGSGKNKDVKQNGNDKEPTKAARRAVMRIGHGEIMVYAFRKPRLTPNRLRFYVWLLCLTRFGER